MITKSDVEKGIKDYLVSSNDLFEEEIKPESKIKNDLKLDSIDVVELIMECEDMFNIAIDDEATSDMQKWTFDGVVDFVYHIIEQQH